MDQNSTLSKPTSPASAPLIVNRIGDISILAICSLKASKPELFHAQTGMQLPEPNRCLRYGLTQLVNVGPRIWLMISRESSAVGYADNTFTSYQMFDQTGAFSIFELSGPAVGLFLRMSANVNWSRTSFYPGCSIVVPLEHIRAIIWMSVEAENVVVAVPRSFACDFERWANRQLDQLADGGSAR